MLWIIQRGFYKNQDELISLLNRFKIKNIEVTMINGKITNDLDIPSSKLAIFCGGLSITEMARNGKLTPGTFINDNFLYGKWLENYKENLLNTESIVGQLETIEPGLDKFFIRPCADTKYFAGKVMTNKEFENWRISLLENRNLCLFIKEEVVISPVKNIYAEYRFFIVDNKIVTCSIYKMGGRALISTEVGQTIIEFVQKMIYEWEPSRAYVLDIAEVEEGLKVIELNNFTSAGFYACDLGKIVSAIEDMSFSRCGSN